MNKNHFSFLTKHLRNVGESYFTHMGHAFYFCLNCIKAGVALLIHSLIPFIFITTGSSTIKKLNDLILIRLQVANLAERKEKQVAIVGFGVSGLLTFLNLVKNYQPDSGKLTIRIFEKSCFLSKGIAYLAKNINLLLNVPAYKMGVTEDQEHFYKWLIAKGYKYEKNDFVPRQIFGIYLEDILEEALKIAKQKKVSYQFFNKKIEEISVKNNNFIIDGNAYNHCVLAVGAGLKNPGESFWNIDPATYIKSPQIHILGAGLTAFDAIISLRDLGYLGKIFIYSRTARMPQFHINHAANEKVELPLKFEDANLALSEIFHKFVIACKNSADWRLCFDAFRPLTQNFWMALDTTKKKRFMRHCFRLWNIHRHRCPESQYLVIEKMIKSGQIIFSKTAPKADHIINCSGFDYAGKSGLINSLIDNNIAVEDELNLGIKSKYDNFYIMGGLNFGSLFEITAVPDIAPEARQVAKEILLRQI